METKSKILKIKNAPIVRGVSKAYYQTHARNVRDLDELIRKSEWNRQLNYFNPLMP